MGFTQEFFDQVNEQFYVVSQNENEVVLAIRDTWSSEEVIRSLEDIQEDCVESIEQVGTMGDNIEWKVTSN